MPGTCPCLVRIAAKLPLKKPRQSQRYLDCLSCLHQCRRTLVVRPKANLQTPLTRWRPGWNASFYDICEEVVERQIPETKDWLLGVRACWLAILTFYDICEEVVGRRIPETKDWLLGFELAGWPNLSRFADLECGIGPALSKCRARAWYCSGR